MADKVKDSSLDWVYLDADHSYAGCLADLIAWVPKVRYGGIVSGHDYNAPQYGVTKAVETFCAMHPNIIIHTISEEDINNTSFWFQKLF